MKRNVLVFIAAAFFCAVLLIFLSTKNFHERKAAPALSERVVERALPNLPFPYAPRPPRLPHIKRLP